MVSVEHTIRDRYMIQKILSNLFPVTMIFEQKINRKGGHGFRGLLENVRCSL